MSKNVLIISTSLRKGSNSDALAEAFAKGAEDAGNNVESISLIGKTINFCRGCLACQELGHCVIKDDALIIEEKALPADVLAFATPIYYYEMSGQMKTLLDRLNPMFPKDYAFRDVYFLSAAADTDKATPQRAITGLEGWIVCFEKAHLAGSVFAGGVTDIGDIKGHKAVEEAYALGRSTK